MKNRTVQPEAITPALQRICNALERQPNLAAADISAQAFVGISTLACGGYLRVLKERRLIHISGWRKVKGRFSTPLYSLGDKPDVTRPRIDDSNRDAPGMDRIVEVLAQFGNLTYREIAQLTGLSLHTVKNSGFLDALLAQQRIHIAQWKRSRNGPMSAVYGAGPGRNAEKPPALNAAEKSRRHRLRNTSAADGAELLTQLAGLRRSADRPS